MNRFPVHYMLILLLSACEVSQTPESITAVDSDRDESALSWPPPPLDARVKYLYQFAQATDINIKSTLRSRLWGWLSGNKQNSGMIRPYAICAENNLIVVADPGGKTVHVFDIKKNSYQKINKVADTDLSSPVGVVITSGRIFIADSVLGKVYAVTHEGDFLFSIDDLNRPTGLAYDKAGQRLYVSDTLDHQIVVYDDQGHRQFSFGQRKENAGGFNYPSHLALSKNRLYVNDTMNFRIQVFTLGGEYLSSFGKHGDASGYFSQPKGIGVDSKGHIYVVDALFHRVQVFDTEGRYLMAFGKQGKNPGQFWLPSGLFIHRDQIYVADSYNRRIQIFEYVGE